MKKSRSIFLHPDTNLGKVEYLESLHGKYVDYLRMCVELLIQKRRCKLLRSEKQAFFPKSEFLTSQIQKNVQDHALQLVNTWATGKYRTNLKKYFKKCKREGLMTEEEHHAYCAMGKYLYTKPSKPKKAGDKPLVTQEVIDDYWNFLLDREISGKVLTVRDNIPMRMSEMTCRLENPESPEIKNVRKREKNKKNFTEKNLGSFWLEISTLEYRKRVSLPLSPNPYIKTVDDVSKGVLARKDKKGRWKFDVVERKVWEDQPSYEEFEDIGFKVGVDVGQNVIAATSDGQLYGEDFKPKFDRVYKRVTQARRNRQQQNPTSFKKVRKKKIRDIRLAKGMPGYQPKTKKKLKKKSIPTPPKSKKNLSYVGKTLHKNLKEHDPSEQNFRKNSKRLDRMESRLSGMNITICGEISNKLIKRYLECTIFVMENLNLQGCKGQKRFMYNCLINMMLMKAIVQQVNPAHTSRMCPSCGYVSEGNRDGVKFECLSCGRKAHADVVGSVNNLGRSQDTEITEETEPWHVEIILRKRYRENRDSSSRRLHEHEPVPSGRVLTTCGKSKKISRHRIEQNGMVCHA